MIIHQTWKSKTDLPPKFSLWRDSFFQLNPNFTINLYDDDDNRNLMVKHLPQLLHVYDAYPLEIYRVDFIRAVYLFFYGGIYADIDVQCLKPLDRYLSISGVCLARMGEYDEFDNSIPNAIMASSKNCGFWLYYMQKMVRISNTADREKNVEWVTGPAVLRSSALDFNNNIEIAKVSIYNFVKEFNISIDFDNIDFSSVNIMNNEIWYPLDWTNEGHQQIRKQVLADEIFIDRNMAAKQFSNSEMVTYWASTWRPA